MRVFFIHSDPLRTVQQRHVTSGDTSIDFIIVIAMRSSMQQKALHISIRVYMAPLLRGGATPSTPSTPFCLAPRAVHGHARQLHGLELLEDLVFKLLITQNTPGRKGSKPNLMFSESVV